MGKLNKTTESCTIYHVNFCYYKIILVIFFLLRCYQKKSQSNNIMSRWLEKTYLYEKDKMMICRQAFSKYLWNWSQAELCRASFSFLLCSYLVFFYHRLQNSLISICLMYSLFCFLPNRVFLYTNLFSFLYIHLFCNLAQFLHFCVYLSTTFLGFYIS